MRSLQAWFDRRDVGALSFHASHNQQDHAGGGSSGYAKPDSAKVGRVVAKETGLPKYQDPKAKVNYRGQAVASGTSGASGYQIDKHLDGSLTVRIKMRAPSSYAPEKDRAAFRDRSNAMTAKARGAVDAAGFKTSVHANFPGEFRVENP